MPSSEEYRRRAVSDRALSQRVAVTGMGVVTAIGDTVGEFWESLLAGRSGVSRIDAFDVSEYPTQIGGVVRDFQMPTSVPRKQARHMARFSQFAVAAAHEAILDAGLPLELESDRAGVYVGSAIGALDETEATVDLMRSKGGMRISPFYIVKAPANLAGFHVANTFRALGYNNSCVTACAAGTQAVGEAAEVIRRGDADLMLAGGCEAGLCELALAAFVVGKALSRQNDVPEAASRPFDRDRDGFIGSEGSGFLVLERLDHALERGARIHAEILGYGASNDAYHLIAPDPEGDGPVRAMESALRNSALPPEAIEHINAHATGTPLGDLAETVAIKKVFGERAYQIPVTALKSMLGHLFGGAGAVEAVGTVLSLKESVIPPTINLDNPDPECDLDYVAHEPRHVDMEIAMSNSFGLGGQNAVVVIARYDE